MSKHKGKNNEICFTNKSLNENKREALGSNVTPNGIISLRLQDHIRVDMTLDRAIRIMNYKSNIAVAVSAATYAKMWYKGVSFTSDECALAYLVDSAGTRTTTDHFSDLNQDFSHQVFYNESLHGPSHVQEAMGVLQKSNYWISSEGTDNWVINNIRISQTVDGVVCIGLNNGHYSLRTSPSNFSAAISTPFLHCTGSLGKTGHLFVRRGERRMHFNGTRFIVRNAGHSAGFDDNQLKVYRITGHFN